MVSDLMGNSPPPGYVEVACADDDAIEGEILRWAGLTDYWDQHADRLVNFGVIHDVLEYCTGVIIERREWDGHSPGRSGVWHTIYAANFEHVKAEMRRLIDALLLPRETDPRQTRHPEDLHTIEGIVGFLRNLANHWGTMRGPAGYQELTRVREKQLNQAADDLAGANVSPKQVARRLRILAKTVKVWTHHLHNEILQAAQAFELASKVKPTDDLP